MTSKPHVSGTGKLTIAICATVLMLVPSVATAGTLSFGLSAGVPLSDLASATGGQDAETGRYTFGPALGLRLGHGFGLDADLLYKRFELGLASNADRASVDRLELPLLLRYELTRVPAGPFVHAGVSFNYVIAVCGADLCGRGAFGEELYCIGGSELVELRHRHTQGPVLGFGFDFAWGKIHLAPELRVTRWVDRNFGTKESSLQSNLTQVELLLQVRVGS